MNRLQILLGALVLMGISAAGSILVYNAVVGGSGEASQPISAPTLDLNAPSITSLSTQVAQLQAENQTLQASLATASAAVASGAVVVEPTAAPVEATAAPAATLVAYSIVPEQSQVSFTLTEDLRGSPTTVIGVTHDVAGEIAVDTGVPANSRVGVIRINARTLATDQGMRNNAIRSRILQSAEAAYEFIDFTPTAVTGLPASISVGQAVTFQVVGDLKIRDITQSVTFDVTATLTSETQLEGSATAKVTRAQYNLVIPSVPGVANVSDEVTLAIQFVAVKK